ncbi:MAG: hypothetical protein CM15mP83_6140 [Flavobacteriaceae bacterium]|nr:MAG: hypothetical protein CM15mP83_6140 [Flavobacteriaceae bacterium]
MEELAKPALTAVEDGTVQLFPKIHEHLSHWMTNIRDWNISRQLWWATDSCLLLWVWKQDFVVAITKEEALEKSTQKTKTLLKEQDLRQENDVLDTWFSSWLWPISVFDGIRFPENEEIQYYYPTQDLVTGPDILFFWLLVCDVGLCFSKSAAFSKCISHRIGRDSQGRKMSKQLGNSPDALALIEKYGAD